MIEPAILGLDLGTGAVKAVVFDGGGRELGKGAANHAGQLRNPVLIEADPEDWWSSVKRAVAAAMSECSANVVAIGLSGQMHGVVALDKANNVVRPAITWLDGRSAQLIPRVLELAAPFQRDLINRPAAGLTAAILHWLSVTEQRSLDRVVAAVQPKDWLGLRLTGRVATDSTDASATGLWHFAQRSWHREFCAALGVADSILPPVLAEHEARGSLLAAAAAELGLPAGIPVAVGRADTAASQLGNGCPPAPGATSLTLGTGAQLCQVLRSDPLEPASGLLALVGPRDADHYLMAGTFSAGLALNWVRRSLSMTWAELYAQAWARPAESSAPLFAPFVAGERLYPNGSALSAGWSGARVHHDASDLARSAVEGCVYVIRQACQIMGSDRQSGPIESIIVTGGGAREHGMRRLVADALGAQVRFGDVVDSSARGAAIAAALVAGWSTSIDESVAMFARPMSAIDPDPKARAIHTQRFLRFADLVDLMSSRAERQS